MIGEENKTEVEKGHEVETKERMERSSAETDGYRRKGLKLKLLRWMEGFPLVPLEFWSNANKGKKKGRRKVASSFWKVAKQKKARKESWTFANHLKLWQLCGFGFLNL